MSRGRHHRPPSRLWAVLSVAFSIAVATGAVILVSNAFVTNESNTAQSPSDRDPRQVTAFATVTRVESPSHVVVRIDASNEDSPVSVIGIQDPPSCAYRSATTFAENRLEGQRVTLVPDPSLPARDRDGRLLYHVVLRSQLSYSDAAIMSGNAIAASYDSWYRNVYEREEKEAQEQENGMWGAPCNESEQTASSSELEPSSSPSTSTARTRTTTSSSLPSSSTTR